MSDDTLTEAGRAELNKRAREAQQRYRAALSEPRLMALAVGVEQQLAHSALHTAEMLGRVIGTEKAEEVVLAAMREAAHTFDAACRFASRKTNS